MQVHEHFEELCALATISQLSAEEHQELLTHLKGCEQCKRAEDEFTVILDQLPAAAPPDVSGDTQDLLSASYRQRFLEKAAVAGIKFTAAFSGSKRSPRAFSFSSFPWRRAAIIAAVVLIIGVVAYALLGIPRVKKIIYSSILTNASQDLSNAAPIKSGESFTSTDLQHIVSQQSQRVISLEPGTSDDGLHRRLSFLQQRLVESGQDRDAILREVERLNQQLTALKAHSEQSDEVLSEASAELKNLKDEEARLTNSLGLSEARNVELSEQITAQASAIERERQLTAVSQDVRELMGARNLHLIDVYDWDGRGKRDKSFGRVFFTEGKSLIFYAFDLPQKDSGSKVTFQAWGQVEGVSPQARNLGVFHIDDHAQKRWVLRVDDPKLLSSVDSLFVTVERSPGGAQPSGKKLLYAYLGTLANHP